MISLLYKFFSVAIKSIGVYVSLCALSVNFVSAQQLPEMRSYENAYGRQTRSITGAPGKHYWQNTGDYKIKVNFNPSSLELKGTVLITYTNNSPDTLTTIVLKLYPNLYKPDAMRNIVIAPEDLSNGVHITNFKIDDREYDSTKRVIKGTNLYVKGSLVLPGQKVQIQADYYYTLNKGSFIRTGQIDRGSFFIAYFFPRIAVYDDIAGWNLYPYTGKEEFYNDYGSFRVELTVPGSYQVWATGELQNGAAVYQPEIRKRIQAAEANSNITDIIDTNDIKHKHVTNDQETNTWIFIANNVTDFAFAISNHYIWKASSVMVDSLTKRRTRVDAVFNPDHQVYNSVVGYARKTVELISYNFPRIPFPYSHETVFEGLDAMEYPMMVNNQPFQEKKEIVEFTAHEVFHALFPFYVGTNETKYSFMDEGWATMTEFYFYSKIDPAGTADYNINDVNKSAGTDEDVPVMTLTPQLYGKARFSDKDLKPALALYYLMEMLGEPAFSKACRKYIEYWKGKHPTPYDFFYCINNASGINLNWFWKNWFFEKNIPDLAISKVIHRRLLYNITITSPGSLAVPIHLNVIYGDGSHDCITRKISCWNNGAKSVILHFNAKMPVTRLILGSNLDVDAYPKNNVWREKGI